jgi:tRNA(Ile)-lysidine synthase
MFGADIVRLDGPRTEAALRDARYSATAGFGLRATGHTASDQVETVLLRLLASGSTRGIRPSRDDGLVRPLLRVWREETQAYCAEHGLAFVEDETNATTKRGL